MTATADVLYLDSNVVFYSVISDREFGESCARILREVDDGSIRVAASVLVIAEVANAIRKIGRVREVERGTGGTPDPPSPGKRISKRAGGWGVSTRAPMPGRGAHARSPGGGGFLP